MSRRATVAARSRGVALVLVLWVVTLLAVIAGNFAYSMRGELQTTSNQLHVAQARALADAGVQRAWYEMLKPPSDAQRWQPDGSVHELLLAGVVVQVAVTAEAGKIDLNAASDALLLGLFKSTGLGDDASAALLDAVLDWRDADSLRRLRGAEAAEYRAAGRASGPANAPFETLEELQQVMGMTPALFRQLAPALTVFTRQPAIDPTVAPPEALRAIPGLSAEQVEQYLRQREAARAAGQSAPPLAVGGPYTVPGAAAALPVYSVRSVARLDDGVVFIREATARLNRAAPQPVTVLAWTEGRADAPVPPGAVRP
jgi:general secretion pathway protein K